MPHVHDLTCVPSKKAMPGSGIMSCEQRLFVVESKPEQAVRVHGQNLWRVGGGGFVRMVPGDRAGDTGMDLLTNDQPNDSKGYFRTDFATHVYLSPGHGDLGLRTTELARAALLFEGATFVGKSDPKKLGWRKEPFVYDVYELPKPLTVKTAGAFAKRIYEKTRSVADQEDARIKTAVAKQDAEYEAHSQKIDKLAPGTRVKVFFQLALGIGGAWAEGVLKSSSNGVSVVSCRPPGKKRTQDCLVPNNQVSVK